MFLDDRKGPTFRLVDRGGRRGDSPTQSSQTHSHLHSRLPCMCISQEVPSLSSSQVCTNWVMKVSLELIAMIIDLLGGKGSSACLVKDIYEVVMFLFSSCMCRELIYGGLFESEILR